MPKNRLDRKSVRRREAEERNAGYSALSLDDKIALVQSRPGSSAKQLKKLNKQKEA